MYVSGIQWNKSHFLPLSFPFLQENLHYLWTLFTYTSTSNSGQTCSNYPFQAEGTAATVLSQLATQRQQLTGAHENVWEMRQAAEKAKKDLASLAAKQRWRKQRLQLIAMVLAVIDFFLFIRLLRCGGSFFCKQQVEYYGNRWFFY